MIVESAGLRQRRRKIPMYYSHFGLTGPVILDVSRVVSGHAHAATLALVIDLLPNLAEPALGEFLRVEAAASGKKQLAVVLAAHLPRRLADVVMTHAGLAADRRPSD